MVYRLVRIEDIFPAFKRFNNYTFTCYAKNLPIRRWQTFRAFQLLYKSYRKRGFVCE